MKYIIIISIILVILFSQCILLTENTEKEYGDVVIKVVGCVDAEFKFKINEITVNWEKQIVLINTNGRAIVYPFYQIQWMSFPEKALNNPYQLMPAGF